MTALAMLSCIDFHRFRFISLILKYSPFRSAANLLMPELFAPGLLREFAHIYFLKTAVLDAFRDPILLFLIQRKDRLSHKAALEDAALYERLFQACMCLAGRLAAAIDGLADVIDAVSPVLSFLQCVLVRIREYLSCRADQFRYAACEADERAVHSREPGYAERLVVACDEADVRALLAKEAYVMLVDGCYACAHLDALDMIDLFAHLDEGLDRIECLGCCRIQVDDDIDVSALCHVLDVLERSIRVHAETEPHMRRHKEDPVCAGFLGFCCHLDGFLCILAVHTGDDRHDIAALLCADLNDSLSLSSCEACDLACVTVADKTLDPLIVEALDPAEIYAELFLVDGIVVIQRNGNCREDSFEILNFCHDFSPLPD